MEKVLEVKGLTKTFKISTKQQKIEKINEKVKVVVDNLSFDAYKGEVFGLLGPNGAGKTTTLRMLATLIRPDTGDAFVDGTSVVNEPELVRSKIGFLTSELKLEEFFTPNYLFDFFAELRNVPDDNAAKRKKDYFERFGIDKFAGERVGNLSTGMKQKTSLAISLVHDPDIIIFDEPTNGLDILTAKVVTDFLKDLKAQGKSIIISTHIFNLVEKLCDRVGIVINGQLVVCDSLDVVCQGKKLEDRFFEIYEDKVGSNDEK